MNTLVTSVTKLLLALGNFTRMLVRPFVTVGLGAAIVQRVASGDLDGAKELGVYFATAMTFWFADRANGPASLGDK